MNNTRTYEVTIKEAISGEEVLTFQAHNMGEAHRRYVQAVAAYFEEHKRKDSLFKDGVQYWVGIADTEQATGPIPVGMLSRGPLVMSPSVWKQWSDYMGETQLPNNNN